MPLAGNHDRQIRLVQFMASVPEGQGPLGRTIPAPFEENAPAKSVDQPRAQAARSLTLNEGTATRALSGPIRTYRVFQRRRTIIAPCGMSVGGIRHIAMTNLAHLPGSLSSGANTCSSPVSTRITSAPVPVTLIGCWTHILRRSRSASRRRANGPDLAFADHRKLTPICVHWALLQFDPA